MNSKEYNLKFDEINALARNIYTFSENYEDDILDILIEAYSFGIEHVCEQLGYRSDVNIKSMSESIYRVIGRKTFVERAIQHALDEDLEEFVMLLESEYHRVYNEATNDGANQIEAENGVSVFKKWNTMRDDRVRGTHGYLEGEAIPLGDEFYTYDGDHALAPGMFQNANNNVNCRCRLDYEIH